MIPTVGFNMRKITKGNVTIKVRAEGCRRPRMFGRATEAPGKSQPGEGRVASCCWGAGRREPKNRKLGDWARGKPGGRKRHAPQGDRDSRKEAWESKLLSVVCLFLRLPSPHPLLTQLWDIGGQPRFRSMWERYCRGVSAIV